MRRLLTALVIVVALLSTVPLTVSADSPILRESYTTADTGLANCYGNIWVAQTFTTTSAYATTSVRLKMYKVGSPGTLVASIRAVNGSYHPTGTDLAIGTVDATAFTTATGGIWYEIEFSTSTSLENATMYAIVLRATSGDASNKVCVRQVTAGGYAGGAYELSDNAAVSWATQAGDFPFEMYGSEVAEVYSAKVFAGFLESGDWLFVFHYLNEYPPYYGEALAPETFDVRLTSVGGATVLAQGKMRSWGNMPGSIYLSSDSVTSLEWGSAYRIRLYCLQGSNPYTDYTLLPSDWSGSDLNWLDWWVLETANSIADYYSTTLTAYVSSSEVLNEQGGTIFETGIPGLSSVRPRLFEVPVTVITYDETEFTHEYEESFDWEAQMGSQTVQMAVSGGELLGVSSRVFMQLVVAGIYLVVAVTLAAKGAGAVSLALGGVVVLAGVLAGVFATGYIALAAFLIAFAFVWMFWFRGAS